MQEGWTKYPYEAYKLKFDPKQDCKASEIKLCNFSRPHMRAFHCSWWGFFIAFFIWFAIAPLLAEIRTTLSLTKQEIWTSSIAGVGGTIFMRFLLGPFCDKYGARILFTIVLCCASIPTALTGAVNSAVGQLCCFHSNLNDSHGVLGFGKSSQLNHGCFVLYSISF